MWTVFGQCANIFFLFLLYIVTVVYYFIVKIFFDQNFDETTIQHLYCYANLPSYRYTHVRSKYTFFIKSK